MACRRGPAVPCAVCGNRAERRRTTGGSRAATLRRRAANERGWVDVLRVPERRPAVQSHDCDCNMDCNFHRDKCQIVPHLTRSRPVRTEPEHTVRRPYPSNTCHTPPAPPRCSNGNGRRAMNGQRPNAVNRTTAPQRYRRHRTVRWNARGNAHPCLRRAGGISIFTLQLSFLGH